jgi:hypothetical protein
VALALDASTPAMVKGTTNPATTATFSPPAQSLLFALCEADETNTFAVSNTGTALSWQSIGVSINQSGQGSIQVFWAWNANAQSNITVSSTRTGSFVANGLKVLVFTGAESTFTGAKIAGLTATVNVTTTANNSWVWAAHIEEGGGADTAASGCTFNDAETSFGGIGGGVLKRTATTPTAGTVVTIGVTAATTPAIVAFEVKESAAVAEGYSTTGWHPGRGPTQARFYKTPRSTDAIAAAPTALTDAAGQAILGSPTDTIAIGVALTDAAFGARHSSTTDTLAIGIALSDGLPDGSRLGDTFGEAAVNSVVVSDPSVGGIRLGGGTDSLAVGVALTDQSAGSTRLGDTTGSLATGIVLLDVITPLRAGSTTDSAGIGVALADGSVGGLRSGDVFGETATVALSISDPSVGGTRLGGNTGTLTSGLVLADTAAGIRLGGKTETLTYAVVLADIAGGIRLGRTTDTYSIGGGTAFICQDFSGTVAIDAYAGSSSIDAYAGAATVVTYDGSASVLSYGGTATNCGR